MPNIDTQSAEENIRLVGPNGNYWYAVELGQNLKNEQVKEVTFWKTSIAIFRGQDGKIRAIENRCAHRHLRLSLSEVHGNELVCMYHGWSYEGSGRCTGMSTDVTGKIKNTPDIKIQSYPVQERFGFIWIFPGNPDLANQVPLPPVKHAEGGDAWTVIPIDITIKAHFSMVAENVCDFNHEFLHRNYKPFTGSKLNSYHREGDTIWVDYTTHLGKGQIAVGTENSGKDLRNIKVWYQYPYQASDSFGKYLHWLFMLPIDEATTRCFFMFQFGRIEIPGIRLNIPFKLRKPLLHLINKFYLIPLLEQDKKALEEEQRGFDIYRRKPNFEFNPIMMLFQKLTLEKWDQYLTEQSIKDPQDG